MHVPTELLCLQPCHLPFQLELLLLKSLSQQSDLCVLSSQFPLLRLNQMRELTQLLMHQI
jgi:hypothetical protein